MSMSPGYGELPIEQRLSALVNNTAAISAIAAAVEGTLGPKGLDAMLVDSGGDLVVTNAGVAILEHMEANHPAARMLIGIARSQHREIGDGTTTATLMAATLISEGLKHALGGVPIPHLLEGIRLGLAEAAAAIRADGYSLTGESDPQLTAVARVAGRGREDIAQLVVNAAGLLGQERLVLPGFRFTDTILARQGADNSLIQGVVISKSRLSRLMPERVAPARVMIMDDPLSPEDPEEGTQGTEGGFARAMNRREDFEQLCNAIITSGVNCLLLSGGIHPWAQELLAGSGIMVATRLTGRDMHRAAGHVGARPATRAVLAGDPTRLSEFLGRAEAVSDIENLHQLRIEGGGGLPAVTVLIGASTAEVLDEQERIAADAAAAVQAALRGGVVAGGGAAELAASRRVEALRTKTPGLARHGIGCVVEALRRPMFQMVKNAGFDPAKKIEEALAAQAADESTHLGIDCDSGRLIDMAAGGILDPLPVKLHALRAAGEVAEAILRINTIVRMRDEQAIMPSALHI